MTGTIADESRRTARKAKDGAREVKRSPAFRALARAGLVSQAVIYLLVGVVALRVAFDGDRQQADQGGALEELAQQPFGAALVWAVGCGIAALALWRLAEALVGTAGPDGHTAKSRVPMAGAALLCAVTSFSVLAFAAGQQGSGSSDEQSRDMTARAMEWPAGRWLVGIAGLVVVGVGVWMGVRAIRRKWREELRPGVPRWGRRLLDVLGVGGELARGVVFATAGFFVCRAALVFDPDEAVGLDNALRSLAAAPAGPWVLTATAVGLMLFGGFALAMARWQRI
ncbi:DUF1206 domain-containing protein [Streptomyces spiramenti]|uniref:DUF1206 domain-containing protein n=1 Tax=Streptomyces spiramenti TaxID=2720606 RepID=A0ABX1ARZ7_9ACTN|nr:DUF1206 domain-containing protein [Streptomyces spiramenti]NJP67187.1 DUF1206 domain-containing protein [Streptomyces spiramenti]